MVSALTGLAVTDVSLYRQYKHQSQKKKNTTNPCYEGNRQDGDRETDAFRLTGAGGTDLQTEEWTSAGAAAGANSRQREHV